MTTPETARFVWRKSTYSSAQSECVEVADNLPYRVGIRDSKNRAQGNLTVARTTWRSFIQHFVRNREM